MGPKKIWLLPGSISILTHFLNVLGLKPKHILPCPFPHLINQCNLKENLNHMF